MSSAGILKEVEGFNFFKPFFDEGIYEDGRELNEQRPYVVRTGINRNAHGSSYVQYQGATVSCAVTAKAGFVDPLRCIRFKIERATSVSKRECDQVQALLNEFSRDSRFVDPHTLVFDTEYQLQLYVSLTISTCDGFLLGSVLTAINAALASTRLPDLKANVLENEDVHEQLVRRRSAFITDTQKLQPLQIKECLYYYGVLISENNDKQTIFLFDPPGELCRRINTRVDIIIGDSDIVYFWQQAGFDNLTDDLRNQILEQAQIQRSTDREMLLVVKNEGAADSENTS